MTRLFLLLLVLIFFPIQALYLGASGVFGCAFIALKSASLFSFSPLSYDSGLFSTIASGMSRRCFAKAFKPHETRSITSWERNQKQLSEIPTATQEDRDLIEFLQRRWLAKTTGFYSFFVNWLCPCFGIDVQIHPETTNSYARDPSNKLSQTYLNRIDAWKKELPYPKDYPLLLTRPGNISHYLPPKVVDVTEGWSEASMDIDHSIYIQRVEKPGMHGICMIPLKESTLQEDYLALLEWISKFGLSANRVELDRLSEHVASSSIIECPAKLDFVKKLEAIELLWTSTHPQKNLLFHATIELLKGLSKEAWHLKSETELLVALSSMKQIEKELETLAFEEKNLSFFETASSIEQIHSHLSSLLEVSSPYASQDFPSIYASVLTCIPTPLKPLTRCTIHATGMTSLAGIFKSVRDTIGHAPFIIYGENIYFEGVRIIELAAEGTSHDKATLEEWARADLLLVQFNPVLKRIELPPSEYRVENVIEMVQKALVGREKSLTVALDCTLDFINSSRIYTLLERFQQEIQAGQLNLICYRSGIKFDLFGIDNYCGAPLYMIHSKESKWDAFDGLIEDPVLLTDRLSQNWFCLAYRFAAPRLEAYRKQIFDNTRALLDQIPAVLQEQGASRYRVVPMSRDANLGFIDIKVFGPFHELRANLLAGLLSTTCMEKKHPIFYRPSIGFYHPNLSILFAQDWSTIRLTLGLDPEQIDLIGRCLARIK